MDSNLAYQEAAKIYTMFCLPRIVIHDNGHQDFEYVWKSEEARKAYNNLLDIGAFLSSEIMRQNTSKSHHNAI